MRRIGVYFFIASILGAFFLWLAARELDLAAVGAYVASADALSLTLWSLVFIGVYGLSHLARIIRWYYLVRPLEPTLDSRLVARVCAVGFTAILLLPLRLGELVRPYLLSRRSTVPMTSALGTAVVERVVDGLTITGLLFVTLATYDGAQEGATQWARAAGLISAAIFVPALLVSFLAMWRRVWTVALVRRIGAFLRLSMIVDKLADLLDAFIEGFQALRRGHDLGKFLALSVVYWTSNALSMWLLGRYGIGLDIGPWDSATILALLVIGIMIPAGPGMAGNFEFFVVKGLALFVILDDPAISGRVGAYAALLHILQFVVIVLPGVAAMIVDPQSRHLVALVDQAEAEEERISSRGDVEG